MIGMDKDGGQPLTTSELPSLSKLRRIDSGRNRFGTKNASVVASVTVKRYPWNIPMLKNAKIKSALEAKLKELEERAEGIEDDLAAKPDAYWDENAIAAEDDED